MQPRTGKSGLFQTLKWTFDKDEVNHYLDIIHRSQTSINLAYSQAVLSTLGTIGDDVTATRNHLDDQEARDILTWLSPIDFEAQQRQVLSDWCPGTLEWFPQHEQIQMWLAGTNPYVWVPGAPGSGKTVLSSFVINAMRSARSSTDKVFGVYLSLQSLTSTHVIEEIFGSLLKQSIGKDGIPETLRDAYRTREQSGRLQLDELLGYPQRVTSSIGSSLCCC